MRFQCFKFATPARRHLFRLLALVSFIALSLRAGAQPNVNPGAIAVTFQPTTVTATGVTPGGSVAFFAIGREPHTYWASIDRWKRVVHDDDRDGVVALDLKTAVPRNSIWAVVDLSTRRFVIATPTGEQPGIIRAEKTHLSRGASGNVERFGLTSAYVDMLYVSADGEAWTWSNTDGSVIGLNYHGYDVTVDAAQAHPLSSEKGLHEFSKGGVIVFFDHLKMRVFAVQLDDAAIGGAR